MTTTLATSLLEDDAWKKLIDMSDAIQFLDAYSIDISLEENPEAVKWKHHFVDKENIPGLDSFVGENCPILLAIGVVAMFTIKGVSGAATTRS